MSVKIASDSMNYSYSKVYTAPSGYENLLVSGFD